MIRLIRHVIPNGSILGSFGLSSTQAILRKIAIQIRLGIATETFFGL